MKLRSHLALVIAAALLPLLLFVGGLVRLVTQQQAQAIEAAVVDTADSVATAVDREMAVSTAALEAFATARAFDHGEIREAYARARTIRAAHPEWGSVFLIDPRGQELFTLLKPLGTPLPNIADQADVREAMRRQRPFVSNLLVGPVSGRPVVRVHVPVLRDGTVLYLLATTLTPEGLASVVSRFAHEQSIVTVVDRHDVVVARTPDGGRWIGQPLADDARRLAPSRTHRIHLGGRQHYVAVQAAPRSGFKVVVAVPVSAVAASLQHPLWLMSGVAALTVTFAIAVSAVVARRITRPMLALARDASAIGAGAPAPSPRTTAVAEVDVVHRALVAAAQRAEDQAVQRERRVAAEAAQDREHALRAEAETANRRKDEFLAMLGHELRNPLAAMTTAMHLFRGDHARAEVTAHARDVMARQLGHLTNILDDLLDLGRVATGKIALRVAPVDLARVTTGVVDQLTLRHAGAERRIALRTEATWVSGDATRLEQVATNLIGNALKYTPAERAIEVDVRTDDATAVLTVRDQGIGMAPEVLTSAFDLFFQADRAGHRAERGLGIGLTLVKRLVALHGGTVTAASEGPGCGSTFSVQLPAVPAATPASQRIEPANGARHRILIVEDNDDARTMLRCTLELEGHEVYEAADGAAGIAMADRVTPEVAIVDLGLPGLDGFAVAREIRLRRDGDAVVLIALSGYGQPEDRQRTAAAGFAAHLVKPVDVAVIEQTIADVLDELAKGKTSPAAGGA